MGILICQLGSSSSSLVRLQTPLIVCSSEIRASRRQALVQLDDALAKGDERAALSIVRNLQQKPGALQFFGAARQVPQRLYTLDELKLNGIETSSILAPADTTLGAIERYLQLGALLGGVLAWNVFGFSAQQLLYFSLGLLFLWTLDSVSLNGGIGRLVLDSSGHIFSQKYRNRVTQHESGHFLVAYLLGILPKGYTLSGFEGLKKEWSLNVQAGTTFVDFEFLEEVNQGKLSSVTLNRFSCIALAGVATEYLLHGYSEGGLVDIVKLDELFKSLSFSQKKADSQVRWAVLNTVAILRRHEKARGELAAAMASGRSIGDCIDVIEVNANPRDL